MAWRARSVWILGIAGWVALGAGCGGKSGSAPDGGGGNGGSSATAGASGGGAVGTGGGAGTGGATGGGGTGGSAGSAGTPMPCAAKALAIGASHVCALTTAGGV